MASRPKRQTYKNGIREHVLIEVTEDAHADHFADEEDMKVTRTPVFMGDITMFEDVDYEQQAEFSRKLAKFFGEYAEWIESRKLREDPNA